MRDYFGTAAVVKRMNALGCVLLLSWCAQTARAFSLLGPFALKMLPEVKTNPLSKPSFAPEPQEKLPYIELEAGRFV